MQTKDRRPQTTDRPVQYIPPRPCITRTTAQVADSLTPEQRAEVDDIHQILSELRRQNPLTSLPPSAEHCYLMSVAGWEWDFQRKGYRATESDWCIAYRYPVPAEGLQLAEIHPFHQPRRNNA